MRSQDDGISAEELTSGMELEILSREGKTYNVLFRELTSNGLLVTMSGFGLLELSWANIEQVEVIPQVMFRTT